MPAHLRHFTPPFACFCILQRQAQMAPLLPSKRCTQSLLPQRNLTCSVHQVMKQLSDKDTVIRLWYSAGTTPLAGGLLSQSELSNPQIWLSLRAVTLSSLALVSRAEAQDRWKWLSCDRPSRPPACGCQGRPPAKAVLTGLGPA